MIFNTVFLKDITINLDSKRMPLNEMERKTLKKKKLYPYCGANGILDYIDEYIFDQEILCIAEDGGSWGYNEKCCYIMNEPCWVNNHAHVLVPIDNVSIKYLYYYLNHVDLNKYITGTTRGKLTKSALEKIQIELPSISVQNKIVYLLDKAQELIEKRKAQIEALDQLTQSVFFEMFGDPATNSKGWEYKKLSDICQNLDSKRVPITSSERKKGIYPYYGASGIVDYVDDYIFDDNLLLVSEDGANLLTRVTPIAFEVEGKIWVNNHAHVLKFDNLSTQRFIKYVFNLQDISHLITGSAQPKLNQKNLNSFMVPVPPIKLQNEFYERVNKIEEKRKVFSSSLLELETLFNALLQKSFTGQLFTEDKVSYL